MSSKKIVFDKPKKKNENNAMIPDNDENTIILNNIFYAADKPYKKFWKEN